MKYNSKVKTALPVPPQYMSPGEIRNGYHKQFNIRQTILTSHDHFFKNTILEVSIQRAYKLFKMINQDKLKCFHGPLLLTSINFDPRMDKYLNPLYSVGLNYLSIHYYHYYHRYYCYHCCCYHDYYHRHYHFYYRYHYLYFVVASIFVTIITIIVLSLLLSLLLFWFYEIDLFDNRFLFLTSAFK